LILVLAIFHRQLSSRMREFRRLILTVPLCEANMKKEFLSEGEGSFLTLYALRSTPYALRPTPPPHTHTSASGKVLHNPDHIHIPSITRIPRTGGIYVFLLAAQYRLKSQRVRHPASLWSKMLHLLLISNNRLWFNFLCSLRLILHYVKKKGGEKI